MPAAGIVLLAVVGTGYAVRAPVRRALVAVVGATLLVPATLTVPVPGIPFLGVTRLLALGLLVNLVGRVRRGELDGAVFRPTRVHAALVLYLAAAALTGVGTADVARPFTLVVDSWIRFLDQLLFFAVVLAAIRAVDDLLWMARSLTVLVGLSAGIALAERALEASYARWWFLDLPQQLTSVAASPLERRGGVGPVRVRAAANFALEFGWYTAFLLPVVVAVAARARSWAIRAVPVAAAVAMLWSNSRSALVALAAGLVLLVVLAGNDRRVVAAVGIGIVAAAVLYVGQPSLREPFQIAGRTGAIDVRQERLPRILEIAADRPYTGVGFDGLRARGVTTVDSSYLIDYGELGIIGVVALVTLLATGIGSVLPGLRAPPGPHRALSAAIVAGLAMAVGGAASFSLFRVLASSRLVWILAALGVALAERARTEVPPTTDTGRWTRRQHVTARAALPLAGVALGVVVAAVVPSYGVATLIFDTVPARRFVPAEEPHVFVGKVLVNTTCEAVEAAADDVPASSVSCDLNPNGIGLGVLRVEADDVDTATEALVGVAEAAREAVPVIRGHLQDDIQVAEPTGARTAPVWLGLLGVSAALLLPVPRRRVPAAVS